MASSSKFKSFARGTRSQLSEELFAGGMRWTSSPLPEGQSRLLVNYDITDAGNNLRPRPGLCTTRVSYPDLSDADQLPDTGMLVRASKACGEAVGVRQQLIVTDPATAEVTSTGLTSQDGYVLTDEVGAQLTDAGAESGEFRIASLKKCLLYLPATATIHDMPKQATEPDARVLGTFAYGNQFMYFQRDGAVFSLATTKIDANGIYAPEVVVPKPLTPKEAVLWGYNMLSDTPYTFPNTTNTGVIQLLGLLPYDLSDVLQMTPVINQSLKLVCNYAAPTGTTHKFVWEWKDMAGTAWNALKEESLNTGALTAATCTFSSPVGAAIVRVTVYLGAETIPKQVMAVGFNFAKSASGSVSNAAPKTYQLASCQGMAYWKNQLVVWAPKEDRTMLFVSDINAPHYFPYPNKAEILDEPIIFGMPLLDSFLVFTTTSLVQLTLSGDGLSWTKKTIQRNLQISPAEINLIQPVKNMVFFKSGNYYYMVVPSTKSLGDLVVAPVSANLVTFFDDFETNVSEVLNAVYGHRDGFTLHTVSNFLDFEDIHNMYTLAPAVPGTPVGEERLLTLDLCYNTVTRAWRAYLFETPGLRTPHQQDVTTRGTYVMLTSNLLLGEMQTCIQYQRFLSRHPGDYFLPPGADCLKNWDVALRAYIRYRNWQVWDTGYREHNTDMKKRYREMQFKLNNLSQEQLRFYTEFNIDGEQRKGMYQYRTEQIVDPDSPSYGLIYITRDPVDPQLVPGTTVLADADDPESEGWILDESLFPEMTMWKVRMPVSGKGYTPRFLLVSRNEADYELMNLIWVFRDMYSR